MTRPLTRDYPWNAAKPASDASGLAARGQDCVTPYQSAARNSELTYFAQALEVNFGLPKMLFEMSSFGIPEFLSDGQCDRMRLRCNITCVRSSVIS